jgi:hypothetical protein
MTEKNRMTLEQAEYALNYLKDYLERGATIKATNPGKGETLRFETDGILGNLTITFPEEVISYFVCMIKQSSAGSVYYLSSTYKTSDDLYNKDNFRKMVTKICLEAEFPESAVDEFIVISLNRI